jgi:hypothetical protein
MKGHDVNKLLIAIVGIPLVLVLIGVLIATSSDVLHPMSVDAATDYLENQNYVVLSHAEYDLIAKEATAAAAVANAEAAVTNAEAAVVAAQETLDVLLLHNENEVFLYPDTCTKTATFTAGDGVDTWGAWAEITDSGATTLSSKFAADSGYLVEIMTHDYSVADKIFMIELSYGAAKTVIGRSKIRSDWTYVQALRSVVIPSGQTVYYRMQCETGNATLEADFRYYFD